MAYDYNSQDNQFDVPNPYKIENFFYFCAAAIQVFGGVTLLLIARNSLGSGSFIAMSPLLIGLVILVHGLVMGAKAMSRLRFFFGRGQPESLAKNLTPDESGTTQGANFLKDLLRHSSLVFPEPSGPLNGVLYSIFPHLIFSPQYVQTVAQRQFQNALAFLITFVSLVISLVGASEESMGWLGLFYFGITLFILLKPIERGASAETDLGYSCCYSWSRCHSNDLKRCNCTRLASRSWTGKHHYFSLCCGDFLFFTRSAESIVSVSASGEYVGCTRQSNDE